MFEKLNSSINLSLLLTDFALQDDAVIHFTDSKMWSLLVWIVGIMEFLAPENIENDSVPFPKNESSDLYHSEIVVIFTTVKCRDGGNGCKKRISRPERHRKLVIDFDCVLRIFSVDYRYQWYEKGEELVIASLEETSFLNGPIIFPQGWVKVRNVYVKRQTDIILRPSPHNLTSKRQNLG